MGTEQKLRTNKNKTEQLSDLYILSNPLDTKDKITIDIKDITDYAFCSYYYKLKREDDNINLRNLYDISLHKTFYSYLLSLQENKLDSTLEFLKYKWGEEWIKSKSRNDILMSSMKRDSYESKRKRGIDAIFTFNDIIANDKQFPIIIGHKYQIEILPNIILTGTFEYIREVTINNKKVIQLIQFLSESFRTLTKISQLYNIGLIASSYAFKEQFNVNFFQSLSVDIEKKKVFSNVYSDKEYNILKDTVKNTVICLQNDICIISPDTKCFSCEYRDICMSKL